MARKELRHCTVRVRDGLAGTALLNESAMAAATDIDIDTVALNTLVTDKVPVGARFTIADETDPIVHVVTARTPADAGPTTNIVFTPALGAGTYTNGMSALTFAPQYIDIKIGDGDAKWTEKNEYNYDLDRGDLDTVREGNQVPMDLSLNFVFEHVRSGTGETITPMEAIKGKDAASEWVSSAEDKCEPYAVDVLIIDTPPCGNAAKETFLFPDFRSENREGSFKDATVSVTGRCNAIEPVVTRG